MNRSAFACLAVLACAGAAAQEPAVTDNDPYAWMEEVEGARPLAWVHEQNARSEAQIAATPQFKQLEGQIRSILDSDAKIPFVEKIGDYYYNFWKNRDHERGVWRRTTLAEYRKPQPKWETVLDLDALNQAEGLEGDRKWVWHGADCLRPDYSRCLIALSHGGSDADVTREFDLGTRQFVEDGFQRPAAKGGMGWIDRDSVYVYTDFGPGSLTTSGYPRIAKQWRRGTPLEQATEVYAGLDTDMYIGASRDDTPGYERDFIGRTLAFYDNELYLRGKDGKPVRIEVPNSAQKIPWRQWLLLELRDPWTVGGHTYSAGSLIVTGFDDFMAGKRAFEVLFEPTAGTSLADIAFTRHHVVLNVMDDVKNRLTVLTHGAGGWTSQPLAVGAGAIGTTSVAAVDKDESDLLWVTTTSYLVPTTLLLADASAPTAAPQALKAMPAFFDAGRDVVEQHFTTSKDGTRVPYFLVRPRDLAYDGTAPTLLYGYGGFELSLTPAYSGGIGKGWLEKGGVYVVANIRGGGEYGPRWHQAALKADRHKAYEDMAAVAQDLIDHKVTSPAHLGVMGGSNGGLMAGNMLVQYPQLFGAVVIQVPLLDMKRYSHLLAGASWMAEYGNPDTDDWNFIRTFSPYHLFDPDRTYPPTLFLTSTRDDRVHPAHARKMAAKMLDAGKDVLYYENVEGGHGGAADNAQSAHMSALAYSFLWERLNRP
ncbi:MAG: prolyl oligopeptidase family serine peptidase [Pseudoxanthomonas sp.]